MRISQRAQSVAPFYAMEFGKHAAALEAQGHHVVKLSLGSPTSAHPLPSSRRCGRPWTGGP